MVYIYINSKVNRDIYIDLNNIRRWKIKIHIYRTKSYIFIIDDDEISSVYKKLRLFLLIGNNLACIYYYY